MIAKRVVIGILGLILLGGIITVLIGLAGGLHPAVSTPRATANQVVYATQGSYLAVEILNDDVVHFEAATQVSAKITQFLTTSPMVVKKNIQGQAI